jgi:hypothetical protein
MNIAKVLDGVWRLEDNNDTDSPKINTSMVILHKGKYLTFIEVDFNVYKLFSCDKMGNVTCKNRHFELQFNDSETVLSVLEKLSNL